MPESFPLTLESTIEQYVLSRRSGRMVSTCHAIRALRMVMSDCALSDPQLTDLIAKAAVEHGLNVSFDGNPDLEE